MSAFPPTKKLLLSLLIILGTANVIIFYTITSQEHLSHLRVSFLDVGQGDAILIQTPHNSHILIDAGPNRKILQELGALLPRTSRDIDIILATHPDTDHIGGMPDIFERYNIDYYVEPGIAGGSTLDKLVEEYARQESHFIQAAQNQLFDFGDGVFLQIIYPLAGVPILNNNYSSVVAKLTYGNTSFLFTGDMPKSIEEYLAERYPETLQSDVLKVGHHGSDTSSSEFFLTTVSPTHTVISAGKNNTYGHPHPDVIDRLDAHNITTYQTATQGTITLISDGYDIYVK